MLRVVKIHAAYRLQLQLSQVFDLLLVAVELFGLEAEVHFVSVALLITLRLECPKACQAFKSRDEKSKEDPSYSIRTN